MAMQVLNLLSIMPWCDRSSKELRHNAALSPDSDFRETNDGSFLQRESREISRRDALEMVRRADRIKRACCSFSALPRCPIPCCPGQCPARSNARSRTLEQELKMRLLSHVQ
jgi:hypothetical protein